MEISAQRSCPNVLCQRCFAMTATIAGLRALVSDDCYLHGTVADAVISAQRGCPFCRHIPKGIKQIPDRQLYISLSEDEENYSGRSLEAEDCYPLSGKTFSDLQFIIVGSEHLALSPLLARAGEYIHLLRLRDSFVLNGSSNPQTTRRRSIPSGDVFTQRSEATIPLSLSGNGCHSVR